MFKKLLSLVLPALVFSFAVHAQTFNKAKMDSVLDVLAANNKTMGSLAITQNGKVIYQKSVGFSSVNGQNFIKANENTKYRIGSISKMFTGVMVFQLIEEGKLTLDTKLDKFFPQIPNASKITIGNMLNHHSGLHNLTDDASFATYMAKPQTHEQMLGHITALPSDFEPGSKGVYSNTNFVLLSYIIEKITGQPYPEMVNKRIIKKIGLKNTYYGHATDAAKNEAFSYDYADTWKQLPQTDMSVPAGAGAMVSTPTDLALFIDALFNGKLINAASLEKMKTIQDKLGMAMMAMPFYERTGYGHGGVIDGFVSTLGYFPEEKMAFSYIKNGGTYSPNNVAIAALSIYFGKPYKVPSFAAAQPGGVDKYLGVYATDAIPMKITITKDGNNLIAQATGQSEFPLDGTSTPGTYTYETAGIVLEFDSANNKLTLKQNGNEIVFKKQE